jgi:hypothetical protein
MAPIDGAIILGGVEEPPIFLKKSLKVPRLAAVVSNLT